MSNRLINFLSVSIIAIISFVLTHSHMPYGAAISMDSLAYMSAAKQFSLGNGVSLPDYTIGQDKVSPLTVWPPLYPVLLSVLIPSAKIFGAEGAYTVGIINILTLGLTLVVFWLVLKQLVHPALALGATLVLSMLPSLQIVYMYAWTEPFFILTVFIAFCCQYRFLVSSTSQRDWLLYIAALMLDVAFYIRYAGVGFFPALILLILLFDTEPWSQKLKKSLIATFVYVAAIIPLFLRNYLLTKTLVGVRSNSIAKLTDDIAAIASLLQQDLLPYSIWLADLIFIVATFIYVMRSEKTLRIHRVMLLCSVIWGFGYILFLIVHRQISHSDLDARMVAPIMPFLIIFLTISFELAVKSSKMFLAPIIIFIVTIFLNEIFVHQSIMVSWRKTGTPGVIQNISYNSTSNFALAGFQLLGRAINIPKEQVLLTDLSRPQILHYFLPENNVKQLPSISKAEEIQSLAELKRAGFVILTSEKYIKLFSEALGDSVFLHLQDSNGKAYEGIVLVRIPIEQTANKM